MRRATGVILQLHKILRLAQKISHDWSASHMKRPYCPAKWLSWWIRVTYETSFPGYSEHEIVITRRFGDLTRRILETNFVLKNTTLPAPAISQKVTKCCACHEKSQCTCCKYCACHAKRMSRWMRITYETPFALRAASGVILQLHQILRLPLKINLMIDPRLIWNVIYSAQSKWSHPSNSPSTAPAPKFWVQDLSEKSLNCFRQNKDDSSMIRGYSEHEIAISHPPLRRPYSSDLGDEFCIEKYNISRSGYLPKSHQMLRLPRKVTVHLLERLRPPRKVTVHLDQILRLTLHLHHLLRLHEKKCTLLFSTLFSLGIYSLWHLFSLGIYSLCASILSGHLFSMGIYSLWASILSEHLFSLGIYSLRIYSLSFKNFLTRKFLIQTSFDKSHAHWHTWMSFSKKGWITNKSFHPIKAHIAHWFAWNHVGWACICACMTTNSLAKRRVFPFCQKGQCFRVPKGPCFLRLDLNSGKVWGFIIFGQPNENVLRSPQNGDCAFISCYKSAIFLAEPIWSSSHHF